MELALTREEDMVNGFGDKIKILTRLHEAGGRLVFLNKSFLS